MHPTKATPRSIIPRLLPQHLLAGNLLISYHTPHPCVISTCLYGPIRRPYRLQNLQINRATHSGLVSFDVPHAPVRHNTPAPRVHQHCTSLHQVSRTAQKVQFPDKGPEVRIGDGVQAFQGTSRLRQSLEYMYQTMGPAQVLPRRLLHLLLLRPVLQQTSQTKCLS
jgi:hypothetical protein